MAQISHPDSHHGFGAFVNVGSPFASSPQEQRIRTFSKASVSSQESFWLSSDSAQSVNSDHLPGDFAAVSSGSPVAGSTSSFPAWNATIPSSFAPQYSSGSLPAHQQAGFYHTLSEQPNPLIQTGGAMWRTASVGSALSHSVDALALADPMKMGPSNLMPMQVPVVKSEPELDFSLAAQQQLGSFRGFPVAQPMVSSMSLPGFAAPSMERHFRLSDADSMTSISSPGAASDMTSPSASSKRGSKRKSQGDVSSFDPDSPIDASPASKTTKKGSKPAGQRRPPPSASQVTESGKPFPVIDTSAKHSSLFIAPDTSGLTKREARLVKNRAAAFLSRQRKREQFEEMEVKCKGISMLVWKMWELIAGPDAPLESIEATTLPALLANEDPMARACLEEVISKKGASIAPTADIVPGSEGSPAPQQSLSTQSAAHVLANADATAESTASISALQKDLENARNEVERLRSDIASSMEREKLLYSELTALRMNPSDQASVLEAMPAAHAGESSTWISSAHTSSQDPGKLFEQVPLPFRGAKGAELPLFVPDSPMSKYTLCGLASPANFGFGSNLEPADATFDLAKTPTLSMFSEQALRTRQMSSQAAHDGRTSGLGLDYRCPCSSAPSIPSSPSTASSFSTSDAPAFKGLPIVLRQNADRKPSTAAMIFVLVGLGLMCSSMTAGTEDVSSAGLGITKSKSMPTGGLPASARAGKIARRASATIKTESELNVPALGSGRPSSHLLQDELSLDLALESSAAVQSEADEDNKSSLRPISQ
ncbi:hypothetical protein BCV70DRAFT_103892 [Testicularia cyperi]|uniref:BZIP domain-containing protein n=1 Tax=Testicularia cyperi TaxID=1882483 RepID=A0A317XPG7_9BASI|nr:hypothetical protein BCV70DRAFT_103892 [Testicularia cyperi]